MINLKCEFCYLFVPEAGQTLREGQGGKHAEEKEDLGHDFFSFLIIIFLIEG